MKIAVYGSLKKSFGNHRLIEHAPKLSTEVIEIPFDMISLGGFPGLVPSKDNENQKINIEVYEVDEPTYKRVERLEGYPSFYDKYPVETSVGPAEIYVLAGNYSSRDRGYYPLVEKTSEQVYNWTR